MYKSFPFVFKSAFSVGNPIFQENVSTILQLLVWGRYLYIVFVLNELYGPIGVHYQRSESLKNTSISLNYRCVFNNGKRKSGIFGFF